MELIIAIALLCQSTGTGDTLYTESPQHAHERQKLCVKETYECMEKHFSVPKSIDNKLLECIK